MTEASLKPSWAKVKFGEVVRLCKDRSSDPKADGIERYVGLEHLEPEDLQIRRWGLVAEGTTFTSRFKPGQVLFGKRRAYQRKVAVADFEGICSGDIYIFESADPKHLLPELLPFICQANRFFDYAIETSMGSLSPRTNWNHLKEFELSLPNIEEQKKIAQLLQCIERVLKNQKNIELKSKKLSESLFDQFISQDWPIVPLKTAVEGTQYGLSVNAGEVGKYPILRMMNIENGLCVENDIKYLDLSDDDFETYRLEDGDVLFNRTNSYELVGRTGVYALGGEHVFASYLVRVKVKEDKLDPYYLTTYLNSARGRQQVLSFTTRGVSQSNVNAQNLRRVKIPLPPLDKQKDLLKRYQSVLRSSVGAGERRYSSEVLKKNHLDQIFPVGDFQ